MEVLAGPAVTALGELFRGASPGHHGRGPIPRGRQHLGREEHEGGDDHVGRDVAEHAGPARGVEIHPFEAELVAVRRTSRRRS